MSSSEQPSGGEPNVDEEPKTRPLNLGGVPANTRVIKLREFGFVGRVSEDARLEIEESELRAELVLTTASQFAFR